jgi:hypothetical protein
MGCETYLPIVDFLSRSVVRRPTSNACTIWQTVFDRHQLLLSIISADVLWSIKGVGVEQRYEGPTTWPRKIVLPFFWMDGREFRCQTRYTPLLHPPLLPRACSRGIGSYNLKVRKETTSDGITASCLFGVVMCGVSLPWLLSGNDCLCVPTRSLF